MRTALTLAMLVAACTDQDENATPSESLATHRYTDREARYAVDAPDEWAVSQERGSTIFTAPHGKKHTIIVRAAPKPVHFVDGRETSTEDVVGATERVLKTLPAATIKRRWEIAGSGFPARAFALTFSPPGVGKPYQRVHVVVVGNERLFHLIYTAPAGETVSDATLEQMVRGLKEEV